MLVNVIVKGLWQLLGKISGNDRSKELVEAVRGSHCCS